MCMILSLHLSILSEYISQKKLLSQIKRMCICLSEVSTLFDWSRHIWTQVVTSQLATIRQSYFIG